MKSDSAHGTTLTGYVVTSPAADFSPTSITGLFAGSSGVLAQYLQTSAANPARAAPERGPATSQTRDL